MRAGTASAITGSRPTTRSPLAGALACAIVLVLLGPGPEAAAQTSGPAPRGDITTVTCAVAPNGDSECAVTQGLATICSVRTTDTLQRSYRIYTYQDLPGCTLPASYWREHGPGGDAPYDDTWDRLGSAGGATEVFDSGRSFAQLLAGDAPDRPYYRLAQAYAAAELNRINAADSPASAMAAYEEAIELLLVLQPDATDGPTVERALGVASRLEDYSAGQLGPRACPPLGNLLSADDVGGTVTGMASDSRGRLVALDDRFGRGQGIVTFAPAGDADAFRVPDEAFAVGGVRKGRFTERQNDCVDLASGQQTTILVGSYPTQPTEMSAAFRDLSRGLKVLVEVTGGILDTPAEVPGAGIGSTTASALAGAAAVAGGGGGSSSAPFPSPALPPALTGGGGGGQVRVPNVIGLTESQGRRALTDVGLRIGRVTRTAALETAPDRMLALLLPSALAQSDDGEGRIVEQSCPPGSMVELGETCDLVVSDSIPVPEPGTLVPFALGLMLIVVVLVRTRRA